MEIFIPVCPVLRIFLLVAVGLFSHGGKNPVWCLLLR